MQLPLRLSIVTAPMKWALTVSVKARGSIFCENLHPLLLDRTLNWSSIHSTTSIADMFSESQEKIKQKSLIFSPKPLDITEFV